MTHSSRDWEILDRALEAMERSVAQIRRAVQLLATRSELDTNFNELEHLLNGNDYQLGCTGDGIHHDEDFSA